MPVEQSSTATALQQNETGVGVQRAADEYTPVIVSCTPDSVSAASLNEQNRKYWNNAGNPDKE